MHSRFKAFCYIKGIKYVYCLSYLIYSVPLLSGQPLLSGHFSKLHTILLLTRSFVTARPRNNIFVLLPYWTRESGRNRAYVSQEKAKAIDLPFCTKEIGKKIISKLFRQGLDWQEKGILTNVLKDPQPLNPAVVVANFVALFVSTDHMDQKAICVSYPVYYHHSYPAACISESITCFLSCLTRSMPRLILRRICPGLYLQVCPLFCLFTYC